MVKLEAQRQALDVLSAYGLDGARLRPIDTGLINRTFRIEHPKRGTFALQRLNPIFGAEVNQDIERVTEHLSAAGMLTPRLVRTQDGAREVVVDDAIWRLLTWVDGRCLDRIDHPDRARSAGRLLGRFHRILADFTAPFAHARVGVHDTQRHLEGLRQALENDVNHPAYAQVAPIGTAILAHATRLPRLPLDLDRVVHGDPKATNLLFDPTTDEAISLVDLDTLARMPVVLELGDAFRSWCSISREDDDRAGFDLDLFSAAVQGYAKGSANFLTPAERAALVIATETIAIELSARFARDALEDRYFGWNQDRFPTRTAHNLVRARNQLSLAQAVLEVRNQAEIRARHAFEEF